MHIVINDVEWKDINDETFNILLYWTVILDKEIPDNNKNIVDKNLKNENFRYNKEYWNDKFDTEELKEILSSIINKQI